MIPWIWEQTPRPFHSSHAVPVCAKLSNGVNLIEPGAPYPFCRTSFWAVYVCQLHICRVVKSMRLTTTVLLMPLCRASFAHMINSRMGGQGLFPQFRAGRSSLLSAVGVRNVYVFWPGQGDGQAVK